MSNRIYKGSKGYIKAQGKREWIKTLLLFCISLGMLILGMVITKQKNPDISWSASRNNLLTVAAVLGILPAARFMISAIMFMKAARYSCPDELYERIKGLTKAAVAYELYLTAYKEEYPLYCCACSENEVIGLLKGNDEQAKRGEKHIQTILKNEGRSNVSIKLFTDEKAFSERIIRMPERSDASEELLAVILQISI